MTNESKGACDCISCSDGKLILRLGKALHTGREALERIAREDYRGPRPTSATIAYNAIAAISQEIKEPS